MKILFATQNTGKQREFQVLTQELGIDAVFPSFFSEVADLDVPETGKTFEENALIKAQAFAKATGITSVADDSGLEVLGLDGFPGIMSDRWMQGTAQDKNLGLIDKMKDLSDRSAQFVSVVCYYDPATQKTEYFRGECKGSIATKEYGSEGFGYDPVFIPEGYEKSFAELGNDTKNKLSHRAKAMDFLKTFLQNTKQE